MLAIAHRTAADRHVGRYSTLYNCLQTGLIVLSQSCPVKDLYMCTHTYQATCWPAECRFTVSTVRVYIITGYIYAPLSLADHVQCCRLFLPYLIILVQHATGQAQESRHLWSKSVATKIAYRAPFAICDHRPQQVSPSCGYYFSRANADRQRPRLYRHLQMDSTRCHKGSEPYVMRNSIEASLTLLFLQQNVDKFQTIWVLHTHSTILMTSIQPQLSVLLSCNTNTL